jgi:N-acetylmuramic acid 6-phosphate (MurNAc-6-P) etherase
MELLKRADGHVKVAIVMHKKNVSPEQARELLKQAGGFMRKALSS